MSRRTTLGLSREGSLEEGTPDEVMEKKRRALDERLRPARLEAARRNAKWSEIADDLVSRGHGLFVSADTDHVYAPVRGVVFETASVAIIADQAPLYFTVAADGGLAFYERRPQTWSEMVARRTRRRARA
jgi:hypothetical protein